MKQANRISIRYIENDFPIDELDHGAWEKADEINIETYWSGEIAPVGRHFRTRLLWSGSAFYVCFLANQNEPLVISEHPNLNSKTIGLWDRDVCEIFVVPDTDEPRKYFEFEIAPTGEWIDLGIYQMPDKRETDWSYNSGMQPAAKIEGDKIKMAIKIPWQAFGKTPRAGDIWLGNLFRCIGSEETRGYLCWQPTKTSEPSFHVPHSFGEFEFIL